MKIGDRVTFKANNGLFAAGTVMGLVQGGMILDIKLDEDCVGYFNKETYIDDGSVDVIAEFVQPLTSH
jgi:hypothetical protein